MLNAAILGASGYTGAELVRLLAWHPHVAIKALTADRKAGQPLGSAFPHLAHLDLPILVSLDDLNTDGLDMVFCALPHGTTQEVIAALPSTLKTVDLSADFRLRDVAAYATWYGHAHRAPALQTEAVYGLTEVARETVKGARLVANPGCYPTAVQLPLIPLLRAGLIRGEGLVADCKSGVSGAGRGAKEANLFAEVAEGIHAYGVAAHRHAPEIEQGLSDAAGKPVLLTFTPHLVPMRRGILATLYVTLAGGTSAQDLHETLSTTYAKEPFVHVLPMGSSPHTQHVSGSNHALMAVTPDRVPGRAIVLCVIDNLVKGAAGQAIQNMNLMAGFAETDGLAMVQPLFP